ncbi:MAG: extracellular solute-binding protein [Roseibium album]|uniref:Bacterial extracellular solute-binding protein n=1 Tax=Roseibium album TaxID=311410 RepID=A0A0M6Z5H2_9HYPH|nr:MULTISPECIES: extracellular solute-binding protein [Stappiaceae]MBG6142687.1 multiple sugar transport system substrate-binding protein [Labrenzia sp. EL_142]MBG6159334.1 multiple sugar transport system substrate-binding protein [Labrenzia sp. EL_162]MBG6165442.1 multiple sugar transport system substrate-binding protein [Labrenzia sp. EL_195]MBG6197578.1 multiple sugar transport system substrate-binding protein [Labrenzia sp. EL_159]MBG6204000.1 multiple sugar transport system substrate-bind
MYEKEKDAIGAFLRGEMDRRALIRRLGGLGMTAASAGTLYNMMANNAHAADFDWQKHKGKSVKLLLNKHPYTDAMIANLPNFKDMTGMDVSYDIFPEDVYFDKVTAALSSRSSEYDAFMTGAYMTWTYGPAGWIVDHNEWLNDPSKTNPNYNWDDMLEGVRKSCAWNGVPGGELGSPDAKQWCIPWGYEQNNITFNAAMFEKAGVKVPTNLDEMLEAAAAVQAANDGVYGVGVRGSRSWATIHPGFLSAYANFGEHDLSNDGGKLSAAMNTAGSKEFHSKWVKMIQESGASDWSTHTWYQVGTDLGAGKSAMIFDADILGYFMNGGENAMAGQLQFAPFAANPAASAPTPNIWIWSLAMSKFSKDLDATWYFMQWASGPEHGLFGATEMDFVNPVRKSVWDSDVFRERLNKNYPGYVEMHDVSAPGASIKFTAQPLFFDLTTEWAATLQRMVANEVPVDEGLDQLAQSMNSQLSEAGLR